MNKITKFSLGLAIASLSIFSCKKEDVSPNDVSTIQAMAKTMNTLNDTKWDFVNYSKEKQPVKLDRKATLEFSEQTNNSINYWGQSFVNYYAGTFSVDNEKGLIIERGDAISTLMGADEASMEAETTYHTKLAKVTFFEVDGTTLKLYLGEKNDPSVEIMTFEKQK